MTTLPSHLALRPLCLLGMLLALLCVSLGRVSAQIHPPAPYGPLPTPALLAYQQRELVAFVHFNMNTFTDAEWGQGNEDPKLFNPTQLDCRQWIAALKSAGFKEAILTAKHHDGFCLWPSAYTEHSVKNSPWKNGKGDVVQEFVDACHAEGVLPGMYLSPWDRTSALYGQGDAYNAYYENQMTELMTHYGDLAEWWMDGANGEGPNGKVQHYDWVIHNKIIQREVPCCVRPLCPAAYLSRIRRTLCVRVPDQSAGSLS